MSATTRGGSRWQFGKRTPLSVARRGFTAVYVGVAMLMLLGFVSLAVDLGRVRTTKAQLMTAADAAALAGASKIPLLQWEDSKDEAIDVAAANIAIQNGTSGGPVNLDRDEDIEFGVWRPGVLPHFIAVGDTDISGRTVQPNQANALHVLARRLSSRGTQVDLFFARAVGHKEIDVTAEATAMIRGGPRDFGLIGLDYVKLGGTTNTDSYDPNLGPYGGSNIHNRGSVASNGDITVLGTANVRGDARCGVDSSVTVLGNAVITGWQAPLDDPPLSYPVQPVNYTSTGSNDNNLIPNRYVQGKKFRPAPNDAALIPITAGPNGIYSFSSWDTNGNNVQLTADARDINVYVSGAFGMTNGTFIIDATQHNVTFFISGDVSIKGPITMNTSSTTQVRFNVNGSWASSGGGGAVTNTSTIPKNFLINMTGANQNLKISTGTYAHIYAPLADVAFDGNPTYADFFGWVVGKTLDVKGNSQLHYDESLPIVVKPFRTSLVQ